jgi:hypothetical protein
MKKSEYETIERFGRLVRHHLHGMAVIQFFETCDNLSKELKYLTEALLRFSSGYTPATMRLIVQRGFAKDIINESDYQRIQNQPVTSPLILYSGIKLLLALSEEDLSLLKRDCFNDLVDCSIKTAVAFNEIERGSKQQKIQGMDLLVRDLAPVIIALLSKTERINENLELLRNEGAKIIKDLV